MSRTTEKPRISIDEIKSRWYDTYCRYMTLKKENGGFKALCYLHKERSASFNIFGNGAFKCYGCGASGGSILDFIMLAGHLDLKGAMEFIIKSNNITAREKKDKIIAPPPKKEPTLIEFNICKFQKRHKDYWNKYLLPESYLNSQNIFAIKALAYNKSVQNIKDEAVFAYYADDVDRVKILRIGQNVTKQQKWRTNLQNDYIYYFPKEKVERLFIAKSVKDRCVLHHHFGLNSCSPQNEDAIFLLQHNYDRLETIADKKTVVYGSDFQGWHESLLITEYTGWEYFNTENYMENIGVNDPASLIEQVGLEALKQLLIKKKFI